MKRPDFKKTMEDVGNWLADKARRAAFWIADRAVDAGGWVASEAKGLWSWANKHPILAASIVTLIAVSAIFPIIAPALATFPYVGPLVMGWMMSNPAWTVPIAAASAVALSVVVSGLIATFVWAAKKLFGRTPDGAGGRSPTYLDELETDPDYVAPNVTNGQANTQTSTVKPSSPWKNFTEAFEIVDVDKEDVVTPTVGVPEVTTGQSEGVSIGRSRYSLHGSNGCSQGSSQSSSIEAAGAAHNELTVSNSNNHSQSSMI